MDSSNLIYPTAFVSDMRCLTHPSGVARVGEVLAVEGEWAVVEWNKEWTDGADVCRVSDLIAVRAATPAEIEAAGYPAHATHAAMSSQAELAMKDGGR